jgi:hypothetical protein
LFEARTELEAPFVSNRGRGAHHNDVLSLERASDEVGAKKGCTAQSGSPFVWTTGPTSEYTTRSMDEGQRERPRSTVSRM